MIKENSLHKPSEILADVRSHPTNKTTAKICVSFMVVENSLSWAALSSIRFVVV